MSNPVELRVSGSGGGSDGDSGSGGSGDGDEGSDGDSGTGGSDDGDDGEKGGNDNGNGKGPKKSSPSSNEKNVSKKPTFKWESVEGADSYTIEVSSTESSLILIEEEVYDTLFTPGREFQPNTKHNWRVRANINGEAADWSES